MRLRQRAHAVHLPVKGVRRVQDHRITIAQGRKHTAVLMSSSSYLVALAATARRLPAAMGALMEAESIMITIVVEDG
jgi:hypothetical protein